MTDGAVKKYYAFGGGTVAMRDGNGLQFFLTDHLGSVLAVADASGALISEQRYLPFGEVRDDVGTITQTDFGYTGQRGLPGTGLMDYRARFYSAYITRFTQPDSIVPEPGNPQALNRYSYALNNSIRYNDPTGHDPHWCTDASCRTDYYNSMMGLWRSAHHRDSGGGGEDGIFVLRQPNPTNTTTATPTPTSCPLALIVCLPTATGTPIPTTSTPYTGLSYRAGESYTVTKYGLDWSKIDIFQGLLDIAGIGGDIALMAAPEGPGEIAEGVITTVEIVAAGKAFYDAFGGDLGNLSTETLVYGLENNYLLSARMGRWIPLVGSIFSGYSLYENLRPAITMTQITKYR